MIASARSRLFLFPARRAPVLGTTFWPKVPLAEDASTPRFEVADASVRLVDSEESAAAFADAMCALAPTTLAFDVECPLRMRNR